jgi:luciferase family oxidoreductase group 1
MTAGAGALGVLDIAGSIEATIELSAVAEELGFARYWIAEHQPQPSPILLASLVAGQTARIRVGTAGVLLHYYPPLRTAHDFALLERAFPGRIDAGFCGGVTPAAALVEPDRDGRDLAAVMAAYPARVEVLVRALRNTGAAPDFEPGLAWGGVGDEPPALWSLGGGARSADLAARLGLGFGYALMFTTSADAPDVAQRYRERFVAHRDRAAPAVIVAVAGICADTDAAARALAATYTGEYFAARVVGGPATCRAAFAELRARYGADEIVFADLCPDLATRRRCYELLATAGA